MSEIINEILSHLESACTAGWKARKDVEISFEEYDIINETIAKLEMQVREMAEPKTIAVQVSLGCPSGSTDWGNLSWTMKVENLEVFKDCLSDFMNERGA